MRHTLALFCFFTFITGLLYPFFITGFAQTFFPIQANGSLINQHGQIIGSSLIGQHFVQDSNFWGRPSATDYQTLPAHGSNLSPTNKKFVEKVQARTELLKAKNGGKTPPADLVYSSGSGLDPHISTESALYQLDRVAKVRNLSAEEITLLTDLIHIQSRTTRNLIPSAYVNVLEINLTLEEQFEHDHKTKP